MKKHAPETDSRRQTQKTM